MADHVDQRRARHGRFRPRAEDSPGVQATSVYNRGNLDQGIKEKQTHCRITSNRSKESKTERSSKAKDETSSVLRERSKTIKSKCTNVYAIISGSVSNTERVSDFVKHRMGNPDIDFAVRKIDQIQKHSTMVTLEFSSVKKATAAVNLLNKSNRNAQNKVHCFMSEAEALGGNAIRTSQREDQLQKAVTELYEVGANFLEKHKGKLFSQTQKVREIEKILNA